jgi:hypothetical protein
MLAPTFDVGLNATKKPFREAAGRGDAASSCLANDVRLPCEPGINARA